MDSINSPVSWKVPLPRNPGKASPVLDCLSPLREKRDSLEPRTPASIKSRFSPCASPFPDHRDLRVLLDIGQVTSLLCLSFLIYKMKIIEALILITVNNNVLRLVMSAC